MSGGADLPAWEWPETGVHRRPDKVRRLIHWSYAGYTLRRRQMTAVGANPFPKGYSFELPKEFGRYDRGEKHIGSLDRETRLLALSSPTCMHCGVGRAEQMDHLIPRLRGGAELPFNMTTSCGRCNAARGAKDLMRWYRDRKLFPYMGLLRHYLKVTYRFAKDMDLLDANPTAAIKAGLPYDPHLLPSHYPSWSVLKWDPRVPA